VTAYLQSLFTAELYKRAQGRYARQWTLYALAILVAAGAWSMKVWMEGAGFSSNAVLVAPLVTFLAGCWAAFRLVQLPRFADFLISVEAEMMKVSWPTLPELVRASSVVIIVIFFLAFVLFGYDALLRAGLALLDSWLVK